MIEKQKDRTREEGHLALRAFRSACSAWVTRRDRGRMGYAARERKRKKKAASTRAQQLARETGSARDRWWLTFVTSTTACAVCGTILRQGREFVYRPVPRESRCVECAHGAVTYRPSLRWERSRRRQQSGQTVSSRRTIKAKRGSGLAQLPD